MWHGDKEISLRRIRSNRYRKKGSKSVLNVKARTSVALSAKTYMVSALVLVPIVLAAVGVIAVFALQKAFSQNPIFNISKVRIERGKVLSEAAIKEYTGISEGVNIFSFNMARIRKDILNRAKNIRNIEITRRLPDKVDIVITERIPVARLGHHGNLVVDVDGCVFAVGRGLSELPLLKGYRGGRMVPGKRLAGMAIPALAMLDVIRYDLKDGIDVKYVEVSAEDKISLYLHDGRSMDLSWEGMREGGEASRANLLKKLGKSLESLVDPRPRFFDATFADRIIGGMARPR